MSLKRFLRVQSKGDRAGIGPGRLPYYAISPGGAAPLEHFAKEAFMQRFYRLDKAPDAADPRFLCICQLDDIWALERANWDRRTLADKGRYLLDRLDSEIGEALRAGRCFLVLDLSGEGHPFVQGAFDDLHAWADRNHYSMRDVVLMSQNRSIEGIYHKEYLGRPDHIGFLSYDWVIAGFAELLDLQGAAFEERFGFPRDVDLRKSAAKLDRRYLCLNATPRPMRIAVLAALDELDLMERTLWSLLKEDAHKHEFTVEEAISFLLDIGQADRLAPYAKAIMAGPPKRLDRPKMGNANDLMWVIDLASYQSTFASIVTETDFTDGAIDRITEKLVKALAMAHPSIVFGNPRSLAMARKFGFGTFDQVIDETYDTISDPAQRFEVARLEVGRLDRLLADPDSKAYGALSEVALANAEHAFGGGFRRTYRQTVEAPLLDALERGTRGYEAPR